LLICALVGSKAPLSLRLELAVWGSEQTPALGGDQNSCLLDRLHSG
jgi:hypothetical protein